MSGLIAGSEVFLKSGGPRMTIDRIGDYSPLGVVGEPHQAKCSWFDSKNQHQSEVFPLHSLKVAEPFDKPVIRRNPSFI